MKECRVYAWQRFRSATFLTDLDHLDPQPKKIRYIFKYASGKSIDIASNNRTPELGRHIAKLLHNNMETFFVI